MDTEVKLQVHVRRFKENSDLNQVEALERRCEAGQAGSSSLFVDFLGDPLCRVRHLPTYAMLVAEVGGHIVGVIRGGVKDVVCRQTTLVRDQRTSFQIPMFARVGYLLGLRVCPSRRRMGIALQLAEKMEEWCEDQGAEYVYMATEKGNAASLQLFTERLHYVHFRTPVMLVNPVFMHERHISSRVQLTKLTPDRATALYRATMGTSEFFPKDIDAVLRNKLCEGTWVATFADDSHTRLSTFGCEGARGGKIMESGWARGASWAIMSVWRTNELFKFEVKGVSWACRTYAALSRWVDYLLPWCRVSSWPNFFAPFGVQFMFGLQSEGERGPELLKALCWHAHNLARKHGCQAIMSEVAPSDPARASIPHWKRLSSTDDMWCIKVIGKKKPALSEFDDFDWCRSTEKPVLFVDPREI